MMSLHPNGPRHYNSSVYLNKIDRLVEVISKVGKEESPDGLSVFGVAEIENESVLKDLVAHPSLSPRGYKIVHYDSPDERGSRCRDSFTIRNTLK
jgi:hypothetical protein